MKKERVVYKLVKSFKKRFSMSVIWRISANSKVVEDHLYPDEKVLYAFAAQKNNSPFNIISTNVVAMTNRRLLLGQKRMLFGYWFTSITPDMFNDLKVSSNFLWGKIYIDTVKEFVTLSNIDKRALPEIENYVTSNMIRQKKKFYNSNKEGF